MSPKVLRVFRRPRSVSINCSDDGFGSRPDADRGDPDDFSAICGVADSARVRGELRTDRGDHVACDAVVHRARPRRYRPARTLAHGARGSAARRQGPRGRDPSPARGSSRREPDPRPARSRRVRRGDRGCRCRADRPRSRASRHERVAAGAHGSGLGPRGRIRNVRTRSSGADRSSYRIFEIDGARLDGNHVRVWNHERSRSRPLRTVRMGDSRDAQQSNYGT